jgi:hypothetical protein
MVNKRLGKGRLLSRLAVVALVGGMLALTAGVVSAHGGGGWFGRLGGDQDALVAEELGITVEKLEAAREAARTRALDQALADGQITQEQYDEYHTHEALQPYLDREALTAAALGISVDQLGEQSLSEWLDELGLDREAFQTKLQEVHSAAVQQAVSDGAITQEQADALSDTMPFGGRGGGLRGGRGGMRGGGMRGSGECDGEPLEDSGFRMRMSPINPDQA